MMSNPNPSKWKERGKWLAHDKFRHHALVAFSITLAQIRQFIESVGECQCQFSPALCAEKSRKNVLTLLDPAGIAPKAVRAMAIQTPKVRRSTVWPGTFFKTARR